MANGHFTAAQLFQHLGLEHIGDQTQIPVAADDAVVIDGDAAAFLAPVLQGIQGQISGCDHIQVVVIVNTKNATFLVELFLHKTFLLRPFPAYSPIRRFITSW